MLSFCILLLSPLFMLSFDMLLWLDFFFLLDDFFLLAELSPFMLSPDMLSCFMLSLDCIWSLLSCFMLSCANMFNDPASTHMAIKLMIFFIALLLDFGTRDLRQAASNKNPELRKSYSRTGAAISRRDQMLIADKASMQLQESSLSRGPV